MMAAQEAVAIMPVIDVPGAANSKARSSDKNITLDMENVRDIGATSRAPYSNATDRQKLGFGWPSLVFEPRLFEPASLFPGNEILCAETEATKTSRRIYGDVGRDEAHADKSANWAVIAGWPGNLFG
jgi:hypothetical protein